MSTRAQCYTGLTPTSNVARSSLPPGLAGLPGNNNNSSLLGLPLTSPDVSCSSAGINQFLKEFFFHFLKLFIRKQIYYKEQLNVMYVWFNQIYNNLNDPFNEEENCGKTHSYNSYLYTLTLHHISLLNYFKTSCGINLNYIVFQERGIWACLAWVSQAVLRL